MESRDPSSLERAAKYTEKIRAYILGDILHLNPSTYDCDGEETEKKE